MNGPNDNNGTPVPQQSLMVPFSTVTTAPEVSASVSASSSQVVWSQHQSTVPTPSGPRPILAPSQAPSSVSSPLVFTSSATTFNGPVISPTTSTDVPSSTQTNGVVMTTDSAPKNSSISSTTPSEQSLSLSSGTLPVIQSVTSVPVPTDSVQQKLTAVFNSKSLLELVKETDTYLQLDDEAEEVRPFQVTINIVNAQSIHSGFLGLHIIIGRVH